MAYMVFCIIPLVILIYAQTHIAEQSLGHQRTIMEEMAKYIHIIQNIGMSLLYPILTAKLVDKSKITLKVNKLDKKVWLLLYIIMMAVVIAIHFYNAIIRFNSITLPISFLFFYTLNMMGTVVAMLVISFVCSPIIEEGINLEVSEIQDMIEKSVLLMEKTRNIKKGFSPLLFSILSLMTVFVLYFTFIGIKSVLGGRYHYLAPDVLCVLGMLLLIYYIISFCDGTHQALAAYSHRLRFTALLSLICNHTILYLEFPLLCFNV